ncbi:hypothetical protein [Parapedobacter tibetensis]|uniref:hypothetical protein n=1 Tax=Parapedobacter tibetensis TaxID=2972951 RepID=UPI00214D99D5|nr:hypothetical protein [Parapedobacter tibetensis]
MMRRVASYINNFTDMSSVQLSSGFQPVADRRSLQAPRSSSWTRIVDSNRPGEILLQFEAIKEAHEYEIVIASELDENGQPLWLEPRTIPRALGNYYSPVVDGVTYYFRVRSRNKRGVSHWSPVASLRARVNS